MMVCFLDSEQSEDYISLQIMMYFMCARGVFEELRKFFIVEKNVSIFNLRVVSAFW